MGGPVQYFTGGPPKKAEARMGWSDWFNSYFPRTYHTVEKGDTLSGLAKKYYGDGSQYMKIYNANRGKLSDPDKIYPGQRLRIP